MLPTAIKKVRALEILDSRGNPTVRVWVELAGGTIGVASVPSGASTGAHEALELRDADQARYGGKGVREACEHVEKELAEVVRGMDARNQRAVDEALCAADGTENKSRYGANAILGISLAAARAAARAAHQPLYRYLRLLLDLPPDNFVLPLPLMNVINGGKHADSGLDIQEYMLLPVGAREFHEAVRWGAEVFHALKGILHERGLATGVGDEGGFAPQLSSNDAPFALLEEAIQAAGYQLGRDFVFGIDAAASEFYQAPQRKYRIQGQLLAREELLALYREWAENFPLRSLEDPLAEDDWNGWARLTKEWGEHLQLVGDDFFVTNVRRLKRGIAAAAANAILIKFNQIGTLTETLDAIRTAQAAAWGVIISHRSGETGDTFIADLAVATNAGQIKTGSLSRAERTEKYNRLMEIERELGAAARYAGGTVLPAT